MPTTMQSIVAHLDSRRDSLERLTETLRSLPADQRRKVFVQFCPKCLEMRGPGWWDRQDCERCSRMACG